MRQTACEFLEHDGPIPIAHRGGMGEAAESSAEAISRAVALGCFVELDVCVTSDGVPLVIHPVGFDTIRTDRPLTAGGKSLTYADVRAIRADGASIVPRFEDVLADNPQMRALVDVKQWPAVGAAARAIQRTAAVKRLSICTFSQLRTDAVVREIVALTGQTVCWGIGLHSTLTLAARPGWLKRNVLPGAAIVQPPYRIVNQRFMDAAVRAGLTVFPWTVNKRSDLIRLLDLGVDGIITDFPSRLQEVIADRRRGS